MNSELRTTLSKEIGAPIESLQTVGGGDISKAYRLKSSDKTYFLKTNSSPFANALFETEAKGLSLLADFVKTPLVIHQGKVSQTAYLLLQHILETKKDRSFWISFGHDLARLHRATSPQFGLDHNNFIGRLPQSNQYRSDWKSFYSDQRLIPQVRMAYDNNLLPKSLLPLFELLYTKLDQICPIEKPALIHGDLWSGNYLVSYNGKNTQAVFIDPSVTYAHREMDLSMTLLFGGFDPLFYESYREAFPLENRFEKRVSVYQLYYLLAHLNMFGTSYLGAVRGALEQYV